MDSNNGVYPQAAAIPYRIGDEGQLEVLLIRRIDQETDPAAKKRWGVPKGLVDAEQSLRETARLEAIEEAGIDGELSARPVGQFTYRKWGGLCHVTVFLMHVTKMLDEYPEREVRKRKWFPLVTASEKARRKRVRQLISNLPRLIENHQPPEAGR